MSKNFKANTTVRVFDRKCKRNREMERIIWIRADDILEALNIVKKTRPFKLNYLTSITKEEYLKGVSSQ